MATDAKIEFFDQPNDLRDRISTGATPSVDFDAADDAIRELGIEFVARLPEELARIVSAFDDVKVASEDSARRTILFRLVHDLKGQAGTFDYDLLTTIGDDLCRFLERHFDLTRVRLQVIGYHIDAMMLIMKERLTGTGGAQGEKMVGTLRRMVERVVEET